MLPDLERLKVFYYIFLRQSIVAASNELNVTQSAVSQTLKKLEEEIRTPLFTRLHRRLVPTAAGEKLFGILEPFMDELKTGLRILEKAKEKPFGLLRIGAPVEFGKAYFPGILAVFREKHPEVTFLLKLGGSATLLPMIGQGSLDMAFVDVFLARSPFWGDISHYSIEPIIDEEVILACSKTYYEKHIQQDHSLRNLSTKEYIAYREDALILKNWFRHHFRKSSVNLNVVMTVNSHQAVITAIKHSSGMGIVASRIVYRDIQEGRIVPITTNRKNIINRISVVQLQDKIPSLTEKAFQAHFMEQIQALDLRKKFLRIA